MPKDYYNILGVERNASPDDIKRAFRRLAHEHHPDKPSGNDEKFKEVNEAYQVLSDAEKRGQYDQYGQTFDQARSGGGPGAGFSGFSGGQNINFEDLGDIFGSMFGGQRGGGQPESRRGNDIRVDVELPVTEAILGTEKEFGLVKLCSCESCSGR